MSIRFIPSAILFLLFALPTALLAQQDFEAGYLIDRNGKREELEILNREWRHNPAEIQIRRGEDQDHITVPTAALREFGITGKARYVNLEVAIEKSSVSRTTRVTERPVQQVERVLLRVEVEGDASLYSYLAPRVSKYFVAVNGERPTQLDYSVTRAPHGGISEARTFVRQLDRLLACPASGPTPADLNYELAEIRPIVLAYNDCSGGGGKQTVYANGTSGERPVTVTLVAGIYHTGFRLFDDANRNLLLDSKNKATLRLGVEVEYPFTYRGLSLSVLARPSYYGFRSPTTRPDGAESAYTMDYRAVDLPLALRYYRSLCPDFRFFAGGGTGIVLPFGELHADGQKLFDMNTMVSVSGEVGARYQERWSLALGYEAQGNGLSGHPLRARTAGMRISAGYTLP